VWPVHRSEPNSGVIFSHRRVPAHLKFAEVDV
jgi:hypothetical protein